MCVCVQKGAVQYHEDGRKEVRHGAACQKAGGAHRVGGKRAGGGEGRGDGDGGGGEDMDLGVGGLGRDRGGVGDLVVW